PRPFTRSPDHPIPSVPPWLARLCARYVTRDARREYAAPMSTVALSQLVGSRVFDAAGATLGRVRGVAVNPQEDPTCISGFLIRTASGDRVLPTGSLALEPRGVRAHTALAEWQSVADPKELFLLEPDLL